MQLIRRGTSTALITPLRNQSRSFVTSGITLAKKKEIDPSLPIPPKGPSSAYTLFVKEWYSKNKEAITDSQTGKVTFTELGAALGKAWSELTENAREGYTKQSKELQTAYNKEYKSFLEGLTPETIKAIETATGKKLRIPGGKKAREIELKNKSGSPDKPLTAFFEFMKEYRVSKDGAQSDVVQQAKKGAEKWRAMSDAEKQEWKDKAGVNKKKYEDWVKAHQ